MVAGCINTRASGPTASQLWHGGDHLLTVLVSARQSTEMRVSALIRGFDGYSQPSGSTWVPQAEFASLSGAHLRCAITRVLELALALLLSRTHRVLVCEQQTRIPLELVQGATHLVLHVV